MDFHATPNTRGRQRNALHSNHGLHSNQDDDLGELGRPAFDIDAAMYFLGDVFGTQEWPGRLSIVTIDACKQVVCHWYESLDDVVNGWRTHATEWAEVNVYCGMAMTAPDVEDRLLTPHNRLVAKPEGGKPAAGGIPGLWADLDFGNDHQSKKRYPSDEDHVGSLLAGLPQPTLIVHSGHGLQAYWLFEEFLPTLTPEERAFGEGLLDDWKQRIQRAFSPFDVDSVFDLARILRLPGTINHKATPVSVRLLSTDGPRYTPQFFASLPTLEPNVPQPKKGTRRSGDSISFNRAAEAPPGLLEAMLAKHEKFRLTWERNRPDLSDQSASGYDMALASICAGSKEWTDQNIVDLLIAHRRNHGDDLKRHNYYARTLAHARTPIKTAGTSKAKPGDVEARQHSSEEPQDAAPGRPGAMRFQRDAGGLGECLQALGLEMRRNNRSLEDEVRPLPGSKDGQRLLAEWKGTHFRPDGWIELSEDMIEALRGWYIPEQCSYRASNGQIYPTRFSKDAWFSAAATRGLWINVDPWQQWLEALPAWDGQSRFISFWTECYGVHPGREQHTTEYLIQASKLLLLPCVGRAYDPGVDASTVVTLAGRQGKGKSLGLKLLFPHGWRRIWYGENVNFRQGTKEIIENSCGSVLEEVAELSGARRAELQRTKALISRLVDKARPAYARKTLSVPRKFHFAASGNLQAGTLQLPEDEEHRRWWVVYIPQTSTARHLIRWMNDNRDQLWAEALHRYRAAGSDSGPESWLIPDDLQQEQHDTADEASHSNEGAAWLAATIDQRFGDEGRGYSMTEMLTELEVFGKGGAEGTTDPLTSIEVAQRISAGSGKVLAMEVAKELSRLDWWKKVATAKKTSIWFPPGTQEFKKRCHPCWQGAYHLTGRPCDHGSQS